MSFKPSEWNPKTINFQPFRFWCQTVMPAVYDDSLSYYELLCKLVAQLNDVMGQTEGSFNDMIERIQNFTKELTDEQNQFEMDIQQDQDDFKGELQRRQDEYEAHITSVTQDYVNKFEALKSYVENYFNNLEVQEEINHKLDQMASDGSLTELLNPLVPPIVQKWLNDNIASGEFPYVLDKSLTQEGAAADAKAVGNIVNWTQGYQKAQLVSGLPIFWTGTDIIGFAPIYIVIPQIKESIPIITEEPYQLHVVNNNLKYLYYYLENNSFTASNNLVLVNTNKLILVGGARQLSATNPLKFNATLISDNTIYWDHKKVFSKSNITIIIKELDYSKVLGSEIVISE